MSIENAKIPNLKQICVCRVPIKYPKIRIYVRKNFKNRVEVIVERSPRIKNLLA